MTRESDTGVGGATDVSSDLRNRITFAVSKNADLFVSIHLNSAGASAYGAEVYYPNSIIAPILDRKVRNLPQVSKSSWSAWDYTTGE